MKIEVKPVDGSSQANTSVELQMAKILRPMLICYSVFGHYFEKNSTTERRLVSLLRKSYCTGVLLIVWIKFFLRFESAKYEQFTFGHKYCSILRTHVWWFLCALGSLTVYRACLRQGWQRLFSDWDELMKEQTEKAAHKRRLTRVVCGASVVFFVIYLCSTAYTVGYSIYSDISGVSDSNTTRHQTGNDLARSIFTKAIDAFTCFAWLGPFALLVVLCLGLNLELFSFRSDFRKEITSDGRFLGEFEAYRRRHHHICRLIESVDGIYSVYLGVSLLINVGQILMQLYLLIWETETDTWGDSVYDGVLTYWITTNIGAVFFFCLCGGTINHLAHAPSASIYGLDVRKTRQITAEVQMFLSRLNGESIGLTALHMFVIDKPTVLSVCGMILTYFLVLVQFLPLTSQ